MFTGCEGLERAVGVIAETAIHPEGIQYALVRMRKQQGRYLVCIRVAVVGQHTIGCSHRKQGVLADRIEIILAGRCPVLGGHRNRHHGGSGSAIMTVTDRILK